MTPRLDTLTAGQRQLWNELGNVSLLDALAAARIAYGAMFNPSITLKALTFFGDGDLGRLAAAAKERLLRAVRSVDLEHFEARVEELQRED